MSAVDLTSQELQDVFGTLMGGTWSNTILFACELYFIYLRLFANSGRESYWTQLGLVAITLVDGVSTVSGYATVWMYTVQFWGDVGVFDVQVTPVRICVLTTDLTAVVFHLFQASHAQRILASKKYPKLQMVCGVLWLVALAPLVGAIWAWVAAASDSNSDPWTIKVIISAATDLLFTLFMLFVLIWNRDHALVSLPESIARSWNATSWAIVVGAPSTMITVLMTIFTYTLIASNITPSLGLNVGRVYTLSMLFVVYRDSGELNLDAAGTETDAGWAGLGLGQGASGIVVDVKTQHQVEINREAPLAAVKLGGLREGMELYAERASGGGKLSAFSAGSGGGFDEDDF